MLMTEDQKKEHVQTIKEPKWRNVYFSKSGKAHYGSSTSDSRVVAESIAANLLARGLKQKHSLFATMQPPLLASDYSWHMQMPVTK